MTDDLSVDDLRRRIPSSDPLVPRRVHEALSAVADDAEVLIHDVPARSLTEVVRRSCAQDERRRADVGRRGRDRDRARHRVAPAADGGGTMTDDPVLEITDARVDVLRLHSPDEATSD
jgi:hypothetical protein